MFALHGHNEQMINLVIDPGVNDITNYNQVIRLHITHEC